MKKKLFAILAVLAVCVVLFVKYETRLKTSTVFSMDTIMSIKIEGNKENLEYAENEIRRLNGVFNAYDKESELYKINDNSGGQMSPDMQDIIKKSLELSKFTQGNFDITLKNLKDLWNITSKNPKVPDETEILSALQKSGMQNINISGNEINLTNGIKLDLGAIAKGYAADVIAQGLKRNGVKKFVLDLGGNVYAYSQEEMLRIGIQNPHSSRGDAVCVLALNDAAVVSSGFYERNFEIDGKVYHHILDPKTGYPAQSGLDQVTIVGKDASLCDAFATAIAVSGLNMAEKLYEEGHEFEYMIVEGNKIYITENLRKTVIQTNSDFEFVIN